MPSNLSLTLAKAKEDLRHSTDSSLSDSFANLVSESAPLHPNDGISGYP